MIGTPIPVHSVGRLPLEYISWDSKNFEKERLLGLLVNAKQIFRQYEEKEKTLSKGRLVYRPFTFVINSKVLEDPRSYLSEIETHLTRDWQSSSSSDGRVTVDEKDLKEFIQQALDGCRYLQTYDRMLLKFVVVSGYLGWIGFSLIHVMSLRSQHQATALAYGKKMALCFVSLLVPR